MHKLRNQKVESWVIVLAVHLFRVSLLFSLLQRIYIQSVFEKGDSVLITVCLSICLPVVEIY